MRPTAPACCCWPGRAPSSSSPPTPSRSRLAAATARLLGGAARALRRRPGCWPPRPRWASTTSCSCSSRWRSRCGGRHATARPWRAGRDARMALTGPGHRGAPGRRGRARPSLRSSPGSPTRRPTSASGSPSSTSQAHWHRHLSWPWTSIGHAVSDLVHWRLLDTSTASVVELFDLVTVVLIAVAAVVACVRIRPSYGVLLALVWCVFTFQTILLSESREVLVLFPFFAALGVWVARHQWRERAAAVLVPAVRLLPPRALRHGQVRRLTAEPLSRAPGAGGPVSLAPWPHGTRPQVPLRRAAEQGARRHGALLGRAGPQGRGPRLQRAARCPTTSATSWPPSRPWPPWPRPRRRCAWARSSSATTTAIPSCWPRRRRPSTC